MQLGRCVVSASEVTGWNLSVWNSRAVISMSWDKVARQLMCAEATVWIFQRVWTIVLRVQRARLIVGGSFDFSMLRM